ncbi:carbamoyl-phosphate synthase large subunit [Babesia caballi]|uniref:Carbamoyl-phosphate synthase large subunit n=1 Tax=Babesia caballi TaxID=5871 RepID=A0AAV4LTM0_BABCB|nr:carbamoyl-phosphate synthase large subunit [Babesia caballi]
MSVNPETDRDLSSWAAAHVRGDGSAALPEDVASVATNEPDSCPPTDDEDCPHSETATDLEPTVPASVPSLSEQATPTRTRKVHRVVSHSCGAPTDGVAGELSPPTEFEFDSAVQQTEQQQPLGDSNDDGSNYDMDLVHQSDASSEYGYEEFDIGTPPRYAPPESSSSFQYYTEPDEAVAASTGTPTPGSVTLPKRRSAIGKQLNKAKHGMKLLARKPYETAVKFTRFCTKRMS